MYKFSKNIVVRSIITLLVIAFGLIGMMSTDGASAAPLGLSEATATSMGTGFSYQGSLTDDEEAANGLYDFRFQIFERTNSGIFQAVSGELDVENVVVTEGLFSTTIYPPKGTFNGEKRYLRVSARKDGEPDFVQIVSAAEVLPAPYALYAAEAGEANSLKNPGDTIIEVGAFNMFQGGTADFMKFSARGNGRMQVTHNGATQVGFVYVPVDIPSQVLGYKQKLKSLSFCFNGASTNAVPVLAGLDWVEVRQADKLDSSVLLTKLYDSPQTKKNQCVNVAADTPQEITGSVWIQFRVMVSPEPLEIGEIKLTFESQEAS